MAAAAVSEAPLLATASTLPTVLLIWVMIELFKRIDTADGTLLLAGFSLCAVVNAAAVLAQIHVMGLSRASGLTIHPNLAGSIAAMIAIALGLESWSHVTECVRRRTSGASEGSRQVGVSAKWLLVLGAASALLVALYSASRGAALGITAGLVVGAIYGLIEFVRRRKGARVLGVGLGGVLVVTGLALTWPALQKLPLFARLNSLSSLAEPLGRDVLWSASLDLVALRPALGYGPSAWFDYVQLVEPAIDPSRIPHAHNLFLELTLQGGLFAAGAALWLLFSVIAGSFRARARISWGVLSVLTVSIVLLVTNMTDSLATQPSVLLTWWLLVVIAVSRLEVRIELEQPQI